MLGRLTVIFNCSDGIDYKVMEQFIKGVTQTGCWTCFDEFNRIDEEVLATFAEQLMTVSRARHQKICHFGGE